MATKVKLRQKPISGNRHSLYLDFYPAITNPITGKLTRREFLGFYIFDKTKDPLNKKHNIDTLQLAEQTRQKRENEINKPEIYTGYEKEQLKIRENGELDFVAYFKKLADKRIGGNSGNWLSAYWYLNKFTNGNLKFADLNDNKCIEFRDFLLTTKSNKSDKVKLSQNSALSYFNKFKATLKQAYKDGYLKTNLNAIVEPIKQAETQRNFLTIEELNKLAKSNCDYISLKNAAIFSALTGLRFSDIEKLIWGELEYIKGNGYFIKFKQKKTKGSEMLPISDQAFNILGERKEPSDKVFEDLDYNLVHRYLLAWLATAGITKKITFHCFRHTYATLQLSNGIDIFTISKMLGHREIKTTQIYAKIIDKTKREAANKIKLDLE